MRGLSLIIIGIFTLLSPLNSFSVNDSPHGKDLKISCDECHNSQGWKIDRKTMTFNHNTTQFPLRGSHVDASCSSCHQNLVFSKATPECASCHTDMHQQTLGENCSRCHTTNSWIVNNITEIHQESRFPLLGAHITADCYDCHKSSSLLLFEPLGVECVDCHLENYQQTTKPNHIDNNYSTDCYECHNITAFSWSGSGYTHTFFPLVGGHEIADCAECHTDPKDYTNISPECISCHEEDFNATTIPNHVELGLSQVCTDCHNLNPGWKPANFPDHDALFPIYSGSHNGEWNSCIDCHNDPANISVFTCIDCHDHNKAEMDDKHQGIGGYLYSSVACLECHPTGSEDGFDHNTSNFPLTGAHVSTQCIDCHTNGYAGTPTDCVACHQTNYNETTNPNHIDLGLASECNTCHTTDPGWKPALFDVHNNYFPLTGSHTTTSCNECHTNGYPNTPTNCVDCHINAYNQTTDPNHADIGFPEDCEQCHTTNPNWTPSTYDHNQYYPLTGAHLDVSCSSCHTNGYPGTPTNCFACHETNYNQTTNPNHVELGLSNDCETCHTTAPGWKPALFDIHNDYYPLTGAHTTTSCNECHTNGYPGTPTNCFACHETDFNQTTNPNHTDASFSTNCDECHTTNPGWTPVNFDHDQYYPLNGAHALIATDCNACHNGDYNNTPNTCFGCHEEDYNQTTDPAHAVAQFPTNCLECHTETAWVPSTFDHDNQYFPIYSGKHQGEWNTCDECHTTPTNYGLFSCIDCHEHNKTDMDDEHQGVSGYVYNSDACYDCHPTGGGGDKLFKMRPLNKKIQR